MPQGKGTYGSSVGRPSKKNKKYQVGGNVPRPGDMPVPGNVPTPNFPQENPALADANKMGQELKSIPLGGIEPEFPTANAMERSETYQLGGEVEPQSLLGSDVKSPLSPSITPTVTDQYKEGGKVEDWKEEGYDFHTEQMKGEILGKKGTHSNYDITDIVKLRARRQKEIKNVDKKGKKKK